MIKWILIFLICTRICKSAAGVSFKNTDHEAQQPAAADDIEYTLEYLLWNCIASIRAENDAAIRYQLEIILTSYPHQMEIIFERIIHSVYDSDLHNYLLTEHFISEYLTLEQTAFACDNLVGEMHQNNHWNSTEIIEFGFIVKGYMESADYVNLEPDYKDKFENAKNKFPNSLISFIWGPSVCIKSIDFSQEYLFAAPFEYNLDQRRRRIFASKNGTHLDSHRVWIIEPRTNSDVTSITLRNNFYHEYLYTAADNFNHDSTRRSIFTWIPSATGPLDDAEYFFRIIPTKRYNQYRLVNIKRNEFLFLSRIMSGINRRNIFSWIEKSDNGDESWGLWEFEKCL